MSIRMYEFRYMRALTGFLLALLLLGIDTDAFGQSKSNAHTDTLRSINERIRVASEKNDLEQTAQGYFDRAMENFNVHLSYRDVVNDLVTSAKIYRNIRDDFGFYKARLALADFYIEEEIYLDEAIKLTAEAYQFYETNDHNLYRAKAVTQLGKAYQKKLDYEKAIAYVEQGLKASVDLENIEMELSNRLLITRLLGNLGNVEKVLEQGMYILNKESTLGTNVVSAETNYVVGANLIMDGQLSQGISFLKNSIEKNQNTNDLAYQSNTLLSQVYFSLDSLTKAFNHLSIANDISKNLYNQKKFAMSNQAAVEYQTIEKDKEIRALEEDNELYAFKLTQRTRFFIIISVLLALAALAAYNYYRLQQQKFRMERLLSKQKNELTQQKINELESSLKIKNLQSMVLGQEAERTRIAEDLHDSLGGTLSTLKLQYDTLQLDHDELGADHDYQKIMGMIDGACAEVRDIARNLKPIALEKLGLTAALKDLVNRYSIRGVLDISLHTHDIDGVLSDEAKLHVYRIIQELLNNSLKHANAKEIDVQVNKMDKELFVVVEDDGIGFDLDSAKQGLGLENLKSRVNVLRGEMEIDTTLERGTSVTVHIPLSTAQFEGLGVNPS